MWCASCVASACAGCACNLCTSAASAVPRRSARLAYCALFAASLILSFLLRQFAAPILKHIPWINAFDQTPPEEWFQMSAVLRVSLGNFLFFAIFTLMMIGVKDQNDRRDAWHHGGWVAKIAIWAVLIILMFCVPNIVITIYGLAQEHGTMSEDVVRNAFSATEEGFLSLVRRTYFIKPSMATIGSCCLVGIIWRGTLYLANLGDSRAVLGCLNASNKIVAEQLTRDHNASMEEVRQELKSLHPDDSQIVVLKNGVWRIKGIIQVSRSIGDAYLKKREFALDPSTSRFHLSEPLRRPVLTSEPSIYTRVLSPQDSFLIFASDGLWEHLTNQQAVEIVYNNPRTGIARRLVQAALKEAARKREMRYSDIKKLDKGVRRYFHDDITVVVVFIDPELRQEGSASVPELSVHGFVDSGGPSSVSGLNGIT